MESDNWTKTKVPSYIVNKIDEFLNRELIVITNETVNLSKLEIEKFLDNELYDQNRISNYFITIDNEELDYLRKLTFEIFVIIDYKKKTCGKIKRKFKVMV